MQLTTTRPAPLGNGTRPANFVLCQIESDDIQATVSEIVRTRKIDKLKNARVVLSEGVLPVEIVIAMGNSELAHIGKPGNQVKQSGPTIDDDLLRAPAVASDWRSVKIEDVEEFNSLIQKSLVDAKLLTLGDIERFMAEGNDLKSISGIQQPTETLILKAIQSRMPPSED